MTRYVIKREDWPSQMLMGLGIGCNANHYTHAIEWTNSYSRAIQFEEEEAQTTIDFITNVMDWELGEQLTIEEIPEQRGGQGNGM